MAKRVKSLIELEEEKKRLEEKLKQQKMKLKVLEKRFKEQYRKREASFLCAIGRTLLNHSMIVKVKRDKDMGFCFVLPINQPQIVEAFTKYADVVSLNDEWLKIKNKITGCNEVAGEGKENEEKGIEEKG